MSVLEEAHARRRQLIAELEACVCEYPINKKFRDNMSGHDNTCPAAALWRAHNLKES